MMKKLLGGILLVLIGLNGFASEEVIFNAEKKRSVLDIYTDPRSEASERYTTVSELCYKSSQVRKAYQALLSLKDQGVILSDSETDEYVRSWISHGKIFVTTYSSKVADEGEDPESTEVIERCRF